ncbi:MAG: Ig-like domain-containing protein [Bacteroidales bacterium]|nr:Ig-like domain-containing protein [Bacteroidales bacterium]
MDVTLPSGVIESSDVADYEFTLEAGYYLKADRAAKYIYPGASGSSGVLLAESPASHALAITFNNGIAQISNGSGYNVRYIVWSTSSHYFSSNADVSGSYSTGICLYKLDDGRQAQEISFSAAAAEYDLYTEAWTVAVPTLNGAQGDVTYSSSDETVATVNNAGTVTPLKVGTATITAKAAGNATYKPGQASYTVTIVDTTPVIPGEGKVYRKVTAQSELVAGGKYLVVYDNGSSSKVFNPIVSGSTFTTSKANAVDVTISGDTITSSELDASQIELRNFDGTNKFAMWVASVERYLILRRNNQSFVADASDDGYRSTFTVNGGTVTIVRDSYNLRYSSSNGYFQVSTNSSSNMALYKLDEGGTTPDPGPEPTTPSYTKVTSITSGGTYLIVSADAGNYNNADGTKAFAGDQNGTAATVNNAAGVITGDYTGYEFVISASGSDYTLLGPNGYVTGNSANTYPRYIQVSSTAGTMSLSMATDFTGTDGQVADAFYFYYTKTSGGSTSKEVLYFNSDGAFKIGGTGRKYGVYLYKKN